MPKLPPQPAIQAMVVCREIWDVKSTNETVLVGPCSRVRHREFPSVIPLSLYAHLTDARGRYEISLQLRDSDGDVVWSTPHGPSLEERDPLLPHRLVLHRVPIEFPGEGRFDLELLANGIVLGQHAIWAQLLDST